MSPPPTEDMYREHILEHYRNPRNFGELDPADLDYVEENPLCGDEIRITGTVDGDTLSDIRFQGRGCAISQAAASLLTERVKGTPLADVRALGRDEVVAMLGVPVSPVRLKCAVLAHAALTKALAARDAKAAGE